MVILITGASHTGKTVLAQNMLEKYKFTYLSVDLLKMGLIRSKNTDLTPQDDRELEEYLWPIVREIIKTAIENEQNLVVEGAYIPFGWEENFSAEYLKEIHYICLVMSRTYIENHFSDIKKYACKIEKRADDCWCTKEFVLKENAYYFEQCKKYHYPYILIDKAYQPNADLIMQTFRNQGQL